ncbi:MAG: FMN-binding protein [Oscillospiraceae bacterium]
MKDRGKRGILFLYAFLVIFVFICVIVSKTTLEKEIACRRTINAIEIKNVDVSDVPSGVYEGACRSDVASARVLVTVKDGAIARIELVQHDNTRGSAAEILPEIVLTQQNINVDAVTGATLSSKVILKAIERALRSGTSSCPGPVRDDMHMVGGTG